MYLIAITFILRLNLGVKICETHQWRKTKNKQDDKEPRNNIEHTNNNP